MNKQQTAKANSHQAIAGIFADHSTEVSSIPALDQAVEAFTDEMLGIDANLTVQTLPGGAGTAKQMALLELIDCAEQTAGAIHSLAEATEDVELGEQVDFSRSILIEGSGASIVARCKGIYDVAKDKLASLADHGVTQPKLTAFNQAIKTYDTLRSTPRQAKAAQPSGSRAEHAAPGLGLAPVVIMASQTHLGSAVLRRPCPLVQRAERVALMAGLALVAGMTGAPGLVFSRW